MSPRELEIHLDAPGGTVPVGRLFIHRGRGRESATFRYDDGWLAAPGAYAIDPQLPLGSGAFHTGPDHDMFRALADSAPDRWGIQLALRDERRRAARDGTTPRVLRESDFLVSVADGLRQGALRLMDLRTRAFIASDRGVPRLVDLPRLVSAATRLDHDADTDDDLRMLLDAGSSLGGARPKANLIDRGRLCIAKFPRESHDEWSVVVWEHIALGMAADAGITTATSRLVDVAGTPVLVVERFDRGPGGRRVGYVSALTMLEARDNDRRTYTDIAEVIETSSPHATRDLRELWRRAAFSILISNADDHLRNHGFLRAGPGWALSPAFDLNPAPDRVGIMSTGVRDPGDALADIRALVDLAAHFRVPNPAEQLRRILDATGTWRARAQRLGVRDETARLAPAFEHPQRDAAVRLTTGRVGP